ncbi:hypothetical protein [Actinoplanes sp. NPDC049118]|uniref:hypothetical protein n=1 Tax=Actinoplanes sp. NPDC049118 TaxID=3155769 RepID=UPI0033DEE123
MDEDESLRRFGLHPSAADLGEIRGLLRAQTQLVQDVQDTELMKLCCVQLFNAGHLDDVLPIWQAKESSWDAHCALDVQLLCGAGLDAAKAHLVADGSPAAAEALRYLADCEAAGDFDDFSVDRQARWWAEYYLDGERAEGMET